MSQWAAQLDTMKKLDATRDTLRTLIAWMAQSANSPIGMHEAKSLLEMLDGNRD